MVLFHQTNVFQSTLFIEIQLIVKSFFHLFYILSAFYVQNMAGFFNESIISSTL